MSVLQRRGVIPGLVAAMLIVHLLLAFDTARQKAVTHDEYWHVPIGLLNLTNGRFGYDNVNPPLIRMWTALPLVMAGAKMPDIQEGLEQSQYGDAFLAANTDEYRRLLTLSRGMVILLSAATGALLSWWAFRLFGAGVSLATAVVWTTEPTILSHASLATTDLGAAFLLTATLVCLWFFAIRPTWQRAVVLGAVLGLAQLSKFTLLVLYPLAPVLWLLIRRFEPADGQIAWKRGAALWGAVLIVSVVVLNVGYLFRGSFAPLASYEFRSRAISGFVPQNGLLGRIPVPLPRDYVEGIDHQRADMEGQHPVYLDGEWSTSGFASYYVFAFLYKLPLVFLGLLLMASACLGWPGSQPRRMGVQFLLLAVPAVLLVLASRESLQLGLRYLLPVFPGLVLFAAQTARWIDRGGDRLRSLSVVVLLCITPLSLRYHPHHLAFFNGLAGGPLGGRAHLVDSNLDWGQDLDGLAEYVQANHIEELHLVYFGMMPPSAAGLEYDLPSSRTPTPGWHAVSVNFVQGRPHVVRNSDGSTRAVGIDEFGYFRFFNPAATIGYSIDVYHLSEEDVQRYHAAVEEALRGLR